MMTSKGAITLACALLAIAAGVAARGDAPAYRVRLDPGHPWRPPFGLERVGRPIAVVVEATSKPSAATYDLAAFLKGKEVGRRTLRFSGEAPFTARASFEGDVDEVVLSAEDGKSTELTRQAIRPEGFEAEAVARPDGVVNPVDLGTILVPSDRLLLGPGQSATLDVAAISRSRGEPKGRLRAWFESAPERAAIAEMPLAENRKAERHLKLPKAPTSREQDTLLVVLDDGNGRELWRKAFPTMIVANPPRWPGFGASYTRLRYDAPISVRDPKAGTFSTLRYEDGWDHGLKDVVVSLPNGSRFVFWRGSSYIPFWAGRRNTGACYEWAEIISQPKDAVDCVEPLMDKELRYGRVEIVESTPARVHVRWTYQSTDLHYKVWGDAAVEDYYFYPDGFGTRVVDLKSDPANNYELHEFIVLTPAETYPFDVLPENLVDALFLDGRKHEYRFPGAAEDWARRSVPEGTPAIYRLRLHKDAGPSAVAFNPNLKKAPPVVFGPFRDRGEVVTPCYWGSHWPLARGNATGNAIDERVHITPCHNSVLSWAGEKPAPLRSAELVTLDTQGRSKPMLERRWAWFIGLTDEPDARLLDRARSFATPPSLDVRGARLAYDAYAPERRALRLDVEAREVAITIRPGPPCVNPVFELSGAPSGPAKVSLAGRPLAPGRFAWDGRTLWLDATLETPTELLIRF